MKIHKKMPVIIAVAAVLLLGAAKPAAMKVFSSFAEAERKLPIYCVETDEKTGVEWCKKAADLGDENAKKYLAEKAAEEAAASKDSLTQEQ